MPRVREWKLTRADCLRKCKQKAQADTERDKAASCRILALYEGMEISTFNETAFAEEQAKSEAAYQDCIRRCLATGAF